MLRWLFFGGLFNWRLRRLLMTFSFHRKYFILNKLFSVKNTFKDGQVWPIKDCRSPTPFTEKPLLFYDVTFSFYRKYFILNKLFPVKNTFKDGRSRITDARYRKTFTFLWRNVLFLQEIFYPQQIISCKKHMQGCPIKDCRSPTPFTEKPLLFYDVNVALTFFRVPI